MYTYAFYTPWMPLRRAGVNFANCLTMHRYNNCSLDLPHKKRQRKEGNLSTAETLTPEGAALEKSADLSTPASTAKSITQVSNAPIVGTKRLYSMACSASLFADDCT